MGERGRNYSKTTLRFSMSLQGYGFFRRDTGGGGGGESGQTLPAANDATPEAAMC